MNNAPIREPAGNQWSGSWTIWFTQLVQNIKSLLSDVAVLNTSIATKAEDGTVVHTTGAETVGGTKTFDASPMVPLIATADSSNKAINSQWVKNQGYGQGTITGVAANRIVYVGTDTGMGYTAAYSLEVTGTQIRILETRTYL